MARGSDTPSTVRETERKYDADDTFQLPRVSELGGGSVGQACPAPEAEPERTVLTATYYDTPDLLLLAAGVTLRRRTGGDDEGWHLKLPAEADSRDEVRLPLIPPGDTAGDPGRHDPPPQLASLVRVYTRDAELVPVAELVTRRRSWVLSDGSDRELAELADDRVTARTLGTQTTTRTWRELEVELAGAGSGRDLDRIERRLLRAGATRSPSGSKLARLLAGPPDAATRPGEPRRPARAGDVVLASLRAQVDRLRAMDPSVRREVPDAVHQMRVAARRMRAMLRGFGRVIDRGRTRQVADELRWLGQRLAGERDTEVLAERLTGQVRALPDELVLGPVRATLTRHLQRRATDARASTLEALDSDRYLALHERLDQLLADPPFTRRAGKAGHRELPKSVAKAFRTLDRRLATAARTPAGPDRDVALHAARKTAKRVRYLAEVVAPVVGTKAERLRKRIKKVQGVLGEHQDAVVARPVLRQWGAAAHAEGRNGFTFGILHAGERARAEWAERELPARWRRARGKRTPSWLR